MGERIRLKADDGHAFSAYHVEPAGPRLGGLIVVMEIFGVNAHIQQVCDGFGGLGYEVLAPALYDRVRRDVEMDYTYEDVQTGRKLREDLGWETPMRDVAACTAFLGERGPVGLTGYCFGGSIAWIAAAQVKGLGCTIGYYGGAITGEFAALVPACPVMLHFGRRDTMIPVEGVDQLAAANPQVAVRLYDADHGFNSDRRANYDAGAASLALRRTLSFLDAHLR